MSLASKLPLVRNESTIMARQSAPPFRRIAAVLGTTLCVAAQPLEAQSPPTVPPDAATTAAVAAARDPRSASPDGYNWVEVEVTIFSSVYGSAPYSEVPVPGSNSLRYLPQLRLLANPADAYRYPFAPPATIGVTADVAVDTVEIVTAEPPAPSPVLEGPVFSPAIPGAFKLLDVERDAYVALDRRFWRFNQLNSRLQSGAEHTVLWHQVWRQPLRVRAQTPALQIIGGPAFGNHNVLEGSLRLSSQGQGVVADLDANVWLTNFASQPPAESDGEWKLPEQPVLQPLVEQQPLQLQAPQRQADNTEAGLALETEALVPVASWYPTSIWQLNQSRDVGPNALYYLDHPAMGLLIEIRPYLVPDSLVPVTDIAADPAGRPFE